MQRYFREAVRDMSYHRRHNGLSAGEVYLLECLFAKIMDVIRLSDDLPNGIIRDCCLVIILTALHATLLFMTVERGALMPVNKANKNRRIDSFTDEECYHNLRFRRADLYRLYNITQFPLFIRCANGTTCNGEYAFCLLLYFIAYPTRLFTLQSIFGREFTQLSRIFQYAVTFMFDTHKENVQGNMAFYSNRFDIYHEAVLPRIRLSRYNANVGFIPVELVDIFAFLDGTGLEIARPSNGAQNPFYNGYMHGHYLIFQGVSFPDGMVVVEGAFAGYQNDMMVWRESLMRLKLVEIMQERLAVGLPRLKVYADKIYNHSVIITAAYSLRTNPGGLQQWQNNLNRIMSDIRVSIEWSFGKIVTRSKFLAFGSPMKIQQSPVSQYYHELL
jgi:nuclease HARBI1